MCSVVGCEKPVFGRGWCSAHYAKWRKYGDPTVVKQTQLHGLTLKERLAQYTRESDGCWEWIGHKDPNGYGRLNVDGKPLLAHRLAWQARFGDIGGAVICHKCDNPACVNVAHMFAGTQTDNLNDMWSKGRGNPKTNIGEAHGRAKLTEVQVREIRASQESDRKLAARYGVSHPVVRAVRLRKTWKHID
jgi:hypothetical protein